MNALNNTVAVGAVATPVWWPALNNISEVAAVILPILGVVWLVVQIIGYLLKAGKDK
jgi:hypothetical protein